MALTRWALKPILQAVTNFVVFDIKDSTDKQRCFAG
jgi:hypothetical protein